ncbi:MAG: DUF5916 domain-containing protein [Ferruginibacter sp.]
MKFLIVAVVLFLFGSASAQSQIKEKKNIVIKKSIEIIKIDGVLNDAAWKTAAIADKFTDFQPTPFTPERPGNETKVYFLYNNDGVYIGGYLHERTKDSIASELTGRDGFGNNDFIGVIFDTYQDKQNGFEYFVSPLNEQYDAKVSPNNEDFAWNAVWQSATKINEDGWSFEMFIPYSAIRFGKKNIQDWGLNIVRQRRKSSQKSTWQVIDPNVNGFLPQEGTISGFENIKPPFRLQLSPYFSTYYTHDGNIPTGEKKSAVAVNGGMDVKYGINQAFTLDMTLIPDFGQVQTDNLFLNLSPFEQRFAENRAFFTEGTELFNKGDLFYSRRIGGQPIRFGNIKIDSTETIIENPTQSKLINATKISGRTQKGLGIGILNAITKPQFAVIEKNDGSTRKFETDPLTNYNVFVLDQTFKNNSSISFVNTSVLRSGKDNDADVAAGLFNFNDKKNTWNVGGQVTVSNTVDKKNIKKTGYAHSLYFGKISGKFTFNIYQDLTDAKFDKSDLGYFTNNNVLDHGGYFAYNWNKPKGWRNNMGMNINANYSRLVTPIDLQKRSSLMYQSARINYNFNAQTKNLWQLYFNANYQFPRNDFYEPRDAGKVVKIGKNAGVYTYFESNNTKKYSWSGALSTRYGGIFNRKALNYELGGKVRFNSKFSIEDYIEVQNAKNDGGWAARVNVGPNGDYETIFSRRNINGVENVLNLKYNFNNTMGLTFRGRHSFTKVNAQQYYQLDDNGNLKTPDNAFTQNRNQNFNFLAVDLLYNWQFKLGSFVTLAWKDIGENFSRSFQKDYFSNLGKVISGKQFTSFSLRIIYFFDYAEFRTKIKYRV